MSYDVKTHYFDISTYAIIFLLGPFLFKNTETKLYKIWKQEDLRFYTFFFFFATVLLKRNVPKKECDGVCADINGMCCDVSRICNFDWKCNKFI